MKINLIYMLCAALFFTPITTKAAPLSIDSTPIFDVGSEESSVIEVGGASYEIDLTDNRKNYSGTLSMEYELSNPTNEKVEWKLSVPVISQFDEVDRDFVVVEDDSGKLAVESRFSQSLTEDQDPSSYMGMDEIEQLFEKTDCSNLDNEEGTLYKIQVPPNITDPEGIQAIRITPLSENCHIYHIDHAAYTNKESGYDFQLKLNGEPQYAYIYVSGQLGKDYTVSYLNADKLEIDTMEIGVVDFIDIGIQWYLEAVKPSDISLQLDLFPYVKQYLSENKDVREPVNILDTIKSVFQSDVLGMYDFYVSLDPGEERTLKISYPVQSKTGEFQYVPFSFHTNVGIEEIVWKFETPSNSYRLTANYGIVENDPYQIKFESPPIGPVDFTLFRGFTSEIIGFSLLVVGLILIIIFPALLLVKRRKRK